MQQFPPQGPVYGGGPQGPYGGPQQHQQGPYYNSGTQYNSAPGGGAYGGPYSAGPHAGPQPYGGPYSQPYQPHNNAYSAEGGSPTWLHQAPGRQKLFLCLSSKRVGIVAQNIQPQRPRYVQARFQHLQMNSLALAACLEHAHTTCSWLPDCVLGRQASLSRACLWVGSRARPAGTPTPRPARTPRAPTRPQTGRAGRLRCDPAV